jgi:hypothetical protein
METALAVADRETATAEAMAMDTQAQLAGKIVVLPLFLVLHGFTSHV